MSQQTLYHLATRLGLGSGIIGGLLHFLTEPPSETDGLYLYKCRLKIKNTLLAAVIDEGRILAGNGIFLGTFMQLIGHARFRAYDSVHFLGRANYFGCDTFVVFDPALVEVLNPPPAPEPEPEPEPRPEPRPARKSSELDLRKAAMIARLLDWQRGP